MPMRPPRHTVGPALAAVLVLLLAKGVAAEPKYVGWPKVEASRDLREIKEKLRESGQFDDVATAFLTETVLPQIELEENRQLIERTRRRIREVLLAELPDDKTHNEMARRIAEFMAARARDEQADMVVRVNAILLVGELRARDAKPWPEAARMLAAAAADGSLPAAVRIAALAGVAKQVEKGASDEALAAARPAVASILEEPRTPDAGPERDWLDGRAIQLAALVQRPAPPKLAAALAALLGDEARPIDLRVRAAAALGETAAATSQLDAAAAVESIRKLAIAALETEEQAAVKRRFEEQYRHGGGPAPGMAAGGGFEGLPPPPQADTAAISSLACRRAAWRLYTLGTAISAGEGKAGLVTLLGDNAEPAKELAKQLVAEAFVIDERPEEAAVLDALDILRPPAPGEKKAARQPKPAESPAAPKPDAEPNASPFENPFK